MNKIYALLVMTLCLLTTFGCQQDHMDEPHSAADGIDMEIRMESDFEMNGRSMITSSKGIHHIEHLYAYVFEGTGENATCVYQEKLPWVPTETPKNSFRCKLGYKSLKDQQEYMILVVSTDNNKDTYDFAASTTPPATDRHLDMTGRKLEEVKLQLAAGVPASMMGYTEIFAGLSTFTSAEPLVRVPLSRRVAGALCYVKDIPAKVNDYSIVGMELHLVGGQNTELSLCPKLQDGKWVFPETTDNKNTENVKLAEYDLKGNGAELSKDGVTLYVPPVNWEGVLQTLPNTALISAYLLPVKADAHFAIVLVGEKRDEQGKVTERHIFTENETGGYFPVKSSTGAETYSIGADHFYSIGKKSKGYSTEGDHPLSLLGSPIIVESSPWGVETVDVKFPSLRNFAKLENGKDYSSYIYNCMNPPLPGTGDDTGGATDIFTLSNVPDNNQGWTLVVEPTCNWLYVRLKGQTTWEKKIEVKETVPKDAVIELWMADYVEDRPDLTKYHPEKDFRTAPLDLTTLSNKHIESLEIRQYNALVVKVLDGNKDYGRRGFSRLDIGQSFDNNGVPQKERSLFQWGFEDRNAGYIFGSAWDNTGYSGHDNFLSAEKKGYAEKLFGESAINKSHQYQKLAGKPNEKSEDKFWFLPARAEINSFMQAHGNNKTYCTDEEFRWSATSLGGGTGSSWDQTYAASPKYNKGKDKELKRNRTNHYPIRQACNF